MKVDTPKTRPGVIKCLEENLLKDTPDHWNYVSVSLLGIHGFGWHAIRKEGVLRFCMGTACIEGSSDL